MNFRYPLIVCLLIMAFTLTGCGLLKKNTTGDNTAQVADTANSTSSTTSSTEKDTSGVQPLPAAGTDATAAQEPRPVTVLSVLPELVAAETIEIKGKTRPGSRVYIAGQEVPLNTKGEFKHPFNLQVGKNEIKVVTLGKDKVEDTQTITIERRPLPPKLTVISPENSDTETITISGQTEKGCIVYVDTTTVKPDREGNFASHVRLKEGTNKIKITSTNKDGGTAEVEKTVTFTPGNPRLQVIIPDETRSNQVTISGITDTNTVLVIYVNDVPTNINLQNGVFSGSITLEEGVNTVTVTAINKWGKKTTVSQNIYYSAPL
ncbi:MAG: hypothetical protein K6T65_11150 [Peptococcaceae bacterium]|nr:hypothetical protein [Peptococcaceae bacterium]